MYVTVRDEIRQQREERAAWAWFGVIVVLFVLSTLGN